MIEFSCMCGHAFGLQDDQAGGLIECPQCGRLNDVPTHTELKQEVPDNTYELASKSDRPDPDEAGADLAYVYQRDIRDSDGNEVHLRLRPGETGAPEETAPDASPVLRPAHEPRLEPSDGEPIPVLEIKEDDASPNTSEIPLARPALQYATGAAMDRIYFGRLFVRLLAPLNVTVMIGVLCIQALLLPLSLVALAGMNVLLVVIGMMAAPFLAHYGNVIEEIGPFGRDELPRPLRDLEWHEDVWAPFISMLGALLICYGPALLFFVAPQQIPGLAPLGAGLAIVLAGAGTFALPAVMLTLTTSGSILNLRLDRLRGMIEACGKDYFRVVGIWTGSALVYALGCTGMCFAICSAIEMVPAPKWLKSWSIMVPVLVAGIFLMHYYCVCLGMLYRVYYNQFPWILQRHVSTRQTNETAGLPSSRRDRAAGRSRAVSRRPGITRDQP